MHTYENIFFAIRGQWNSNRTDRLLVTYWFCEKIDFFHRVRLHKAGRQLLSVIKVLQNSVMRHTRKKM